MSLWWPGEWDRLISRLEDWILKRNGYSKLQTIQLSRACQTFRRPDGERLVCTTYNFSRNDSQPNFCRNGGRKACYLHQPSSVEITEDAGIADRCMNSLDKMDRILKQYERAFSKLPRRGPKSSRYLHNQQLDILNEEVIQSMFLKCYGVNRRTENEVTTTRM